TPARQRFPEGFDPSAYDLQPVRLETWSGFMFLCFSREAPPLEAFLGRVPHYLGQHRRTETQPLLTLTQAVACNWKNYHDNTLCDYHVAIAHRHTLHPIQGPIKHYVHEFDRYVNLLKTPVTDAWQSTGQLLQGLPPTAQSHFFTFGIYPNLHLLGLPDGTLIWLRIDPVTAQTCHLTLEIYGIPDLSPPLDTLEADFKAFMAEDIALTESVQQGYASGTYQPGPVNQLEHRIVHQQQLIAQALKDAA
ncbi:MAG: SRPBCC family protein, partial [Cyanobacteria bacterium J06632_22]